MSNSRIPERQSREGSPNMCIRKDSMTRSNGQYKLVFVRAHWLKVQRIALEKEGALIQSLLTGLTTKAWS